MPLTYTLRGVDGTVWDLSDPESPVRLVDDPDGIWGPTRESVWQEDVGVAGSYYKGQVVGRNPITMELRLGPWPAGERRAGPLAWRAALGGGRNLCTLEVESDDSGSMRWQRCRLDLDRLPPLPLHLIESTGVWLKEKVVLVGDLGYWTSRAVSRTVNPAAPGSVRSRADIDRWPQWIIDGPTTGLKIGLDGEKVALVDLVAGQSYRIDTDPAGPAKIYRAVTGSESGVDVWASAAGVQRWRKPARPGDTPITVEGTAAHIELIVPQVHEWAMS